MKNKWLKALVALPLIWSCSADQSCPEVPSYQPGNLIYGIGSPFQLQGDENTLILTDYVLEPAAIDSISSTDKGLTLSRTKEAVVLKGIMTQPLAYLNLYSQGREEQIVLMASKLMNYEFKFMPKAPANDVFYKGEINGWTPSRNPLTKNEDGSFSAFFELIPGEYAYKLMVDGEEISDYNNQDSVSNNNGGFNSVMTVGHPNVERPKLQTEKIAGKQLSISATQPLAAALALWNNTRIPVCLSGTELTIEIPPFAKGERSHIRVYAFNENGQTNDLLIPLSEQSVITNTSALSRFDKHTYRMYFLMVDRFVNGDSTNDKPLNLPEVHPKVDYFGGDLAGVSQQIEQGYFDALGVNTVWLSPIVQNPTTAWGQWPDSPNTRFSGYHGYWPISSTKVDFRFGSNDELKQLLQSAHKRNANVLLDYVANHVHVEHPVYKNHPDWATDLYLPDGTKNTEKWDEHRLTTWFDDHLATLNLEDTLVINRMIDSAVYWFSAFDIDGFRHDATKHISLEFWRALTIRLKQNALANGNRPFYQIGETYGSPELIGSYVNSGMLDAQFDFNLYDAAVEAFAVENKSFERLAKTLQKSLNTYGHHHLMGNISGNQDRARFISYADGSVKFDEDAKKAGWHRNIEVQQPQAYAKLAQLHAFNHTVPGIPVIYYGDEYGAPGANDPDNRRMMRFADLNENEQALKETVGQVLSLRAKRIELNYGTLNLIQANEESLVFERNYFDQRTLVVFNKTAQPIRISLPDSTTAWQTNFNQNITQKNGKQQLEVAPFAFEMLTNP